MKKSLLSIVMLIVLSIVFYPQKELTSKVNGSPGGKTGSPADGGSCIQCHDDFALNSGVGIPNITSNIPSTGYVPGVTYTITSSIAEAGLVRFGFEVTAEDASNNKVGTFFITNTTETKFANGTSNTAVTHKNAGTSGINTKSWDCDWEAPVSGTGPVTFYSACNAANDDGDDDDDYIYTTNTAYQESVLPPLSCSVTGINLLCFQNSSGTIDLTVTGGTISYTYLWTGPGGPYTTEDLNGLAAGTYTVTVTDANGATTTCSITLTEPPALNITATVTNVSCFGMCDGSASVSVVGGIMPYSYSWSNGQTTSTITNLCAGAYWVEIIDVNGCLTLFTVMIMEPDALSISVDSTDETSALNDGSATASVLGGTPAYTYAWSNGGVTNPQVNLAPGLYTVIITDANGCTISDATSVNAYNPTGVINIKNTSKTLIKVTDVLGQETPYRRNTPLFYIYDDGTVEKKIIIE